MRYLKYSGIESVYRHYYESKSNTIEDVRDICIELEHDDFLILLRKEAGVSEQTLRIQKACSIIHNSSQLRFFNYNEVSDVIERLREYLGHRIMDVKVCIYNPRENEFDWYDFDSAYQRLSKIYILKIEFNL